MYLLLYSLSHSGEISLRFWFERQILGSLTAFTHPSHIFQSALSVIILISICLTSGFFKVGMKLMGEDRGEVNYYTMDP